MATGYLHPACAESMAEFGTPRELPQCGGNILERNIAGFTHRDAMGIYPLFACRDWSRLSSDLNTIGNDLVSLTLVSDPFGNYNTSCLQNCFNVVIPFKEHFVTDLIRPIGDVVSKDHQESANLASKKGVVVKICPDPLAFVDDWMDLFSVLTEKHSIKGLKAFSKTTFIKQFTYPGINNVTGYSS